MPDLPCYFDIATEPKRISNNGCERIRLTWNVLVTRRGSHDFIRCCGVASASFMTPTKKPKGVEPSVSLANNRVDFNLVSTSVVTTAAWMRVVR